jgi:dipeptidyl aminopeptidase/acylaminoacyl peptidase
LEIRAAAPANFSPDGTSLLVSSNLTGTMQLYRVPRAGGDLVQLTDFDEPVGGAYLPVGGEIVVTRDEGGNERHQLWLMADEPGAELRPLVNDPEHIHRLGGASRDGALLSYSSNSRNGVDFDVYVVPVDGSAPPRMVFDMGGWCVAGGFSPDGRWLAVGRLTERNGDEDLYLVGVRADGAQGDGAGAGAGEVIHVSPHEDDAQYSLPSWLPDSSGFFFTTDQGRDRAAVARYDLARRSWEYALERSWDCSVTMNWPGTRLLLTTNEEGCTTAELLDPASLAVVAEVPLPEQGIASFGFSRDGRYLACGFTSARIAGDVWVYDCETGADPTRLTTSPGAVDPDEMSAPTLHRFASFDGEEIPVFLYGRQGPVVVYIHGGPEGQFTPGWNPLIQFFVARGFSVAAPNVRGSTGYGKRFHHLDDVRKRLDSVADLAALHDWLGTVDGVDADRAALFGGSYGGYMVLAGLAFQPERWAAGVDIVGISSLVTFLENTSDWRRKFREREYGSLEHDREFLESVSPINFVDQMRAPLFIIHGANDPRVPLSEAEAIHKVLVDRGVRCELLVYQDEGHGLAKLKNRLDAYPRAADFLDEVLGAG